MIQNIRALPGAVSAACASGLPLGNNGWQTSFTVDGRPAPPPGQAPLMEACSVSPDYFHTMNIPLKAGRWFTEQDNKQRLAGRDLSKLTEGQREVAGLNAMVIDDEFARRYWPNEDAVGKRIRLGGSGSNNPILTVIGVVGRVKMEGLDTDSNRVQGYMPFLQLPGAGMTVIVRTSTDPEQMIAAARNQVKAIDPNQPIYDVRTLEQIRAESIAPERLNLMLLGLFAALALTLAVVGIYGVMSYAVTQRTQEIGVRMALGAGRRHVLSLVVGQGMKLALIGTGVGLIAAFGFTRLMATLLFGVKTTDPATFGVIATLLVTVALLACYVPARRATKVDPVLALRDE